MYFLCEVNLLFFHCSFAGASRFTSRGWRGPTGCLQLCWTSSLRSVAFFIVCLISNPTAALGLTFCNILLLVPPGLPAEDGGPYGVLLFAPGSKSNQKPLVDCTLSIGNYYLRVV